MFDRLRRTISRDWMGWVRDGGLAVGSAIVARVVLAGMATAPRPSTETTLVTAVLDGLYAVTHVFHTALLGTTPATALSSALPVWGPLARVSPGMCLVLVLVLLALSLTPLLVTAPVVALGQPFLALTAAALPNALVDYPPPEPQQSEFEPETETGSRGPHSRSR